ncbi:ABC transporter ATP-binding protein [Gorillibacterium massiliense]|uniref:ABC transporter ATP-binding protein n=1 Tax=Gorillibacterium massiliense TaxID=1280390 RepID=UPI0004B29551|nr:ABC transporter ATP-binding protein [Gorillibacterium massiliense]
MSMLELRQVRKVYGDGDSQTAVLNGLDFKVEAGEFVAVLGPSGSGKSTFLSIAGALLAPTSGEVFIDGEALSGKSEKERADFRLRKIGFMFQSAQLLPFLKVKEQLLFSAKQANIQSAEGNRRANELLDQLHISHRSNVYPEKLSGGEKQRVAIARAWMNHPAILFADEPTASLDFERGKEVVRMLADAVRTEGKAAVMVTHDQRMLEWCTRVLRLENGILREA